MKALLHIEWIKNGYKASTWVLLGLYIVIVPLMFAYFRSLYFDFQGMEVEAASIFTLTPENIWGFVTFFASYLIWLFVMLIVVSSSADLQYGIWKQHVIEGLDRWQVLLSKLLLIAVVGLIATLVLFVIGAATAYYSDLALNRDVFGIVIQKMAAYWLYLFGFMLFGFTINLFLKSTGFTLILMLLWVWIVEPIIRFFDRSDITNYLPANCFNDLIRYPFPPDFQLPAQQISAMDSLIGSVAWILIFTAIAFWYLKKKDL